MRSLENEREGRIRPAAAGPGWLRHATGMSLGAAFRIRPQYKKSNTGWCWTFCGGGGRIRFSAEKPRPGKQSTGLFAWTGLSNPSPKQKRDTPEGVSLFWRLLTK